MMKYVVKAGVFNYDVQTKKVKLRKEKGSLSVYIVRQWVVRILKGKHM